ncbi:aldehyde dehydrogenase family protein [Alicyclobacillus sp. SO9]|uniref:aldehyde dehydrogenase family protein n=1 Tax=Alicyclobacillus sp. SO9 TaxID=2665646 RepID=UPI0018E7B3AF|nr:aldehyde dehydrogenase family protein [Alicyclobacillus sp. SO9]QQE79035.1 aldehyde dehydrogenase family protein [Alicyclobacillus sp. SO9]
MKTQTAGTPMLIAGQWEYGRDTIDVLDPQDNSLIDTVPAATKEDLLRALDAAQEGVKIAEQLTVKQRMEVLQGAADYVESRSEEYAIVIAREASKTIREARKEVARCVKTLRVSAGETRRISGETIPFDEAAGGENRVGYYYRIPIGLIAAITPFNDPLNLVAHKVGPAIAGGNAVIVKPATVTPLSALKLAEAFIAAGLPEKVLTVITGHGSEIGDALVSHPAVRMVSFTGGLDAGNHISKTAGLKKIGMELGSNSPVIVLSDADLEDAVQASVSGAFYAAGQNCLGVQRIYVQNDVYDKFIDRFVSSTKHLQTGDKLSEETDMGPLITEKEAKRIEKWVNEAVLDGAQILTGGHRNGAYYEPTVLVNVTPGSKIAVEEVFGPVVSIFRVSNLNEAINFANSVNYGLQAGIFTNGVSEAFKAIQRLEVGGVMINDSSDYRLDAMPFGGVKASGLGREGIRFSLEQMTEPKVACFKLS